MEVAQEAMRLQREADERVEAARRKAERDVESKIARTRKKVLGDRADEPDAITEERPPRTDPEDEGGSGRRLRTY
jgi:hypothetical protein